MSHFKSQIKVLVLISNSITASLDPRGRMNVKITLRLTQHKRLFNIKSITNRMAQLQFPKISLYLYYYAVYIASHPRPF